jgi:Arc/MetJ family transcription regulator
MSTRTNIVLDDDLIAQAMAKARVKTKKGAVEAALRAYVRKPDYSGLLALAGSGVIADDYDPKALFTHPRYSKQPFGDALLANEPKTDWPAPADPVRPASKKSSPPSSS